MTDNPPPPSTLADFLRNVQAGQETAIEVARQICPDTGAMTVRLALERRQLQPEPPNHPLRVESLARAHEFHDPEALAAYLATYGGANTVAWASVDERTITACLDEKAGHQRELVTCRPTLHPIFEPWHTVLADALDIGDFAAFVRQNRRTIVDPPGADVAMLFGQVIASRHTTMHRGTGRHAINGVVCETEIQGVARTEPVDLPDTLTIEAPLFLRSEPARLAIDLTVRLNADDAVVVIATSPDVAERMLDAFEAMLDALRGRGVAAGLGRPQYKPWEYLTGSR